MSQNFELLHEGFVNELKELEIFIKHSDDYIYKNKRNNFENQMQNIVSNIHNLCDSLYNEFEESNENDYNEIQNKYKILLQILEEKLSYDEKTYLRIKYNIDFI